MRGLAATYVVFFHAKPHLFAGGSYLSKLRPVAQWSWYERAYLALLQTLRMGHEFVIFFFVLSGFSIAYSVSKSYNLLGFYKRRLIRIYPPYLLGIAWALVVYMLIGITVPMWLDNNISNDTSMMLGTTPDFFSIRNIIKTIFYNPHGELIVPYWSLPHEIIFYILIPFFAKSFRLYLLLSCLFFIYYISAQKNLWINDGILYSYFFHYNIYFAVGMSIYYYGTFIEKPFKLFTNKYLFWITAAALFLLMLAFKVKSETDIIITEILAVVLAIILIKYFINKNYQPKILAFLGVFSYTIYIAHLPAIYLFKLLLHKIYGYDGGLITIWYIWLLGALFSLLCCYGLYFLAEHPSKLWLMRLRKSEKSRF